MLRDVNSYTFAPFVLVCALATACGLSAAQVNGIVRGSLTFACSAVQPFVPTKDAALASTICTDATIGAGVIGDIIEAAIDPPPQGVRVVHPQGEVRLVPVTCAGAGGVVGMVPPGIVERVQGGLNGRKECAK